MGACALILAKRVITSSLYYRMVTYVERIANATYKRGPSPTCQSIFSAARLGESLGDKAPGRVGRYKVARILPSTSSNWNGFGGRRPVEAVKGRTNDARVRGLWTSRRTIGRPILVQS